MGRKRKSKEDAWMPPRVRMGKSAYEFRTVDGRTIRLCSKGSAKSKVWIEYEKILTEFANKNTMDVLCKKFFNSGDFTELATETQKDYKKYFNKITAVFGKMNPDSIKPEHIRKYMDIRGKNSKTQANREKAFLSRVFRWGFERGLVKINPCKGVKQFKETSRSRYVTDSEYNELFSVAPILVKCAMELAYLCCARQGDILELKKSQLTEKGIFIQQNKTSVAQIKAWSDRLHDAINLASKLPLDKGFSSIYVLHQKSGSRYTRDAFNAQWMKAKQKAKELHPDMLFDFTFHDLKAKGISDLEGSLSEKQAISGHKSASQTARYDRKIVVVPVVGSQNK